MRHRVWIAGLVATLALILIPIALFFPRSEPPPDNPQAAVPRRPPSTDHVPLMPGPYASGTEVTHACLACHPDDAEEMLASVHWTWESQPY